MVFNVCKVFQDLMSRTIHCMDALDYLNSLSDHGASLPANTCGFTSIPDISELRIFPGNDQVDNYKTWFVDVASLLMSKLSPSSYIVFVQSDVRCIINKKVNQWIDKSHLCSLAAAKSNFKMMWHKIVHISKDSTKKSFERPTFSHFICYAKCSQLNDSKMGNETCYSSQAFAVPDLFHRGDMLWARGIGLDCCYVGVSFLKKIAHAKCILDPFSGLGTVVAMANVFGLDSIGIELSNKRCKAAKTLNLQDHLSTINTTLMYHNLDDTQQKLQSKNLKSMKKRSSWIPNNQLKSETKHWIWLVIGMIIILIVGTFIASRSILSKRIFNCIV